MKKSKTRFNATPKMKSATRSGVAVLAIVSFGVACSTSNKFQRNPANQGDGRGGDWNQQIPWGGQHAGGDWGGQFNPEVYRNPDAHSREFLRDNCQQVVPQSAPSAKWLKKHGLRSVASTQGGSNGGGQVAHPAPTGTPTQPSTGHTQTPAPRPSPSPSPSPSHATVVQQPTPVKPTPVQPNPVQPIPVQPVQPVQTQPAKPAFDRALALQQCEDGRQEAINQARQATQWLGITDGYMAAFDSGRRDGMAAADQNKYGQGYQTWVNQSNSSASSRGQSSGNNDGSSQATSDVVGMFQAAATSSGGTIPASNPPGSFNVSFPGFSDGWTFTGHAVPNYSLIMQRWVDSNISSLNLPDAHDMGDHFRYGGSALDRDHFRSFWTNDGYWSPGYSFHVEAPAWDDSNDGWNNFNHAQNGTYFVQGYRSAYQEAAEFWYRVSFYQGANRGSPRDAGFNAGKYVQENYSEQSGEMAGFNFAYQRDSLSGYKTGYSSGYGASYGATYADYSRNPKINFNLSGLRSSMGSFISGADVTAALHIVNYGGRGVQLKVSSSGLTATDDGSTSALLNVAALQITDQTTASIGKIQPGFVNGQSSNIAVDVQQIYGNSSIDLGSQTVTEVLDSWAEIRGVSWQQPLNQFVQGAAAFQVAVVNPLSNTTPGNIDLVGTVGGTEVGRTHLGQLTGGQSVMASIQVKGLDPVQVLSQGVWVQLRLEMAGGAQAVITSNASGGVGFTPDPSVGYKAEFTSRSYFTAMYFDSLVTSGAPQDQINAASAIISNFADQEISVVNDQDFNLWGGSDSASESVVVQLGYFYYNHQSKTSAYTAAYEALGDSLIGKSAGEGIQPHGLFGKWNNRDGFRNAVKVFAPNVKLPN
jgi:hypothetical protein